MAAVVSGANNDPRERFLALLMIHGAKWAYEIADQRENFTHANAVLMRLLEKHGDSPNQLGKPQSRLSAFFRARKQTGFDGMQAMGALVDRRKGAGFSTDFLPCRRKPGTCER